MPPKFETGPVATSIVNSARWIDSHPQLARRNFLLLLFGSSLACPVLLEINSLLRLDQASRRRWWRNQEANPALPPTVIEVNPHTYAIDASQTIDIHPTPAWKNLGEESATFIFMDESAFKAGYEQQVVDILANSEPTRTVTTTDHGWTIHIPSFPTDFPDFPLTDQEKYTTSLEAFLNASIYASYATDHQVATSGTKPDMKTLTDKFYQEITQGHLPPLVTVDTPLTPH